MKQTPKVAQPFAARTSKLGSNKGTAGIVKTSSSAAGILHNPAAKSIAEENPHHVKIIQTKRRNKMEAAAAGIIDCTKKST